LVYNEKRTVLEILKQIEAINLDLEKNLGNWGFFILRGEQNLLFDKTWINI